MKKLKERARKLLKEFKGEDYIFGIDCLDRVGELVPPFGKRTLLITNLGNRSKRDLTTILHSLKQEGVEVTDLIPSAKPNAPLEDVWRLKEEVIKASPECVIVVAGGSGIDAAKAAIVLSLLGGDIETYFGVGKVTDKIKSTGKDLIPLIAVQTASSSAAHLTKYSNITDWKTGQKKLIVDEAIIPPKALFDYRLTQSMPPNLTLDGAFDGMAHCIEVFYGASPELFDSIEDVAETGMELIIAFIKKAFVDGEDEENREALGLGTDLGGYAIMLGGTSGPHLTSFSFVDILSHGRACAIMMPYYTVFFGPAIQRQLHALIQIYAKYNLVDPKASHFQGRDLAEAAAEGMLRLAESLEYPATLNDIPGFSDDHMRRALEAAKNLQLEMKLKDMPVPLTSEMVDDYMGPVLEAARTGDFGLIKNL